MKLSVDDLSRGSIFPKVRPLYREHVAYFFNISGRHRVNGAVLNWT